MYLKTHSLNTLFYYHHTAPRVKSQEIASCYYFQQKKPYVKACGTAYALLNDSKLKYFL